MLATAALTALALLACWRLLRLLKFCSSGAAAAPPLRPGEVEEVLLPIETSTVMLNAIPVSTITFFEGDATTASQGLRRRVAAVLRANAWLRGCVLRRRADDTVVLRGPVRKIRPCSRHLCI